ncbi:uncharacterized protein LOC100187250 isoform X3 [Ciona intestinalis]
MVTYSCLIGLSLIGNATIKCRSNGQWTSPPRCINNCPALTILNGSIAPAGPYAAGTTARVDCNRGFYRNGSAIMTCPADGQWKTITNCQVPFGCPAPNITNGALVPALTAYDAFARVTFTCNSGYALIGSNVAVCANGQWSSQPPECRNFCGAPPTARDGTNFPNLRVNKQGAVVLYSCNAGFTLVGASITRCLPGGVWSIPSPTCRPGATTCADNPCLNGGACSMVDNAYTCRCTGSWVGTNCQVPLSDAVPASIKFDAPFLAAYRNLSSPAAKQLVKEFKTALRLIFLATGTNVDIIIKSIMQGSVVFDCLVVPQRPGEVISKKAISDQIEQAITSGNFPMTTLGSPEPDANECRMNTDNCRTEATCINTIGSFECQCPSGTFGDGVTSCSASNFCSGVDCGNGVCQVTATGHRCVCNTGYRRGTTGVCDADVLECQMSPPKCGRNGICVEALGSFSCTCSRGWTGTTCDMNINECTTNPCDPNANCQDTPGSYRCTCRSGYVGDGKQCNKIILFPMNNYRTLRLDYQPITLRFPVPLAGGYTRFFTINKNGVITFPKSWFAVSLALNTPTVNLEQFSFLAPFWDHFDSKDVRYMVREDRNGLPDTMPGLPTLKTMIKEKHNYNITATTLIIVQWNKMLMFPAARYPGVTSTFQCVIISDINRSFVFFVYQPGEMKWVKDATVRIVNNVLSGLGNQNGLEHVRRGMYTPDRSSNIGINGIYLYEYSYPNSSEHKCLRWMGRQTVPDVIPEAQPCAPLMMFQRSDMIEITRRDQSLGLPTIPGVTCFRSAFATQITPVCCYTRGRFSFVSRFYRNILRSSMPSLLAVTTYREEEIDSFNNCCGRQVSRSALPFTCSGFFRFRPQATTTTFRFRRTVWGFGDPHFTNKDQVEFTLNGHGEYILVDQPGQFMMQGRAEPALNVNGTETKATFFTAIAARNLATGDTVTFSANAAGDDTIVLINGVVRQFPSRIGDAAFVSGLLYRKSSNINYEVVFSPNVTVTAFTANGVVGFANKFSPEFESSMRGLLGPIEYRNGTSVNVDSLRIRNHSQLLDGTIDQMKIFPIGQSWLIQPAETLFTYDITNSFSFYNRPNKVPEFLRSLVDNLNNATLTNIINTCGIKNLACVYDFALTGNQQLAVSSGNIAQEAERLEALAANTAPTLTYDTEQSTYVVNGTLRMEVGVSTKMQFKANDVDNNTLSFSVNSDEIPGVTISSAGLLTFVGSAANFVSSPFTLQVTVNDTFLEVTVEVPMLVCDCNKRGTCLWEESIVNGTDKYGLVQCNCEAAYDGVNCNADADGCTGKPCFGNCMDVPAPQSGFTCAPCPAHLTGNGTTCIDRDECAEGTDNCAQNCTNVVNSFNCSCRAGFMVDSSNSSNCVNANECMMNPTICAAGGSAAVCLDTEGSYMCSCQSGYQMDASGICVDIPDCNNRTICDNTTSLCQETPGSYTCDCKMGYSRPPGSSPQSPCSNTNECAISPPVCSAGSQCSDLVGSFQCDCLSGHSRISPTVCSVNTTSCANINCTTEGSVCNEHGSNPITCDCPPNKVKQGNKCRAHYKFQQRLRDLFKLDYNNLNSPASQLFINNFKNLMRQLLAAINYADLIVTELRNGSVIVLYDLVMNETAPVVSQEQVLVTISQAIASGQFNTSLFDGAPASLTAHLDNMCPKKNITQLNLQALQNQAFTTSLTCQPSLVGINIDYCNLTNAGISPADLVIAGPGPLPANVDAACRPRILSLPDGRLTVTFLLFDILSCGVRAGMDQETITLSYDVRNMPPTTGVIQRYFDACITFNCTFNRTAQVDFGPIDPRIGKLALAAKSGAGRFDISMNLFRDENCTMPFQSIGGNPPNVLVEEYIYFKATINRHNAHMVLQAPKCWATPTADPRGMQKYDIIQEGCASAMDKPNIKVVKNYETYYISAGVASFIWNNITDQRIYIHCEVDVCYNTSGSCSGPTCPSRRKRFVGQVNHPNSKLYSIGPLKIVSACDELEPQTCSQKCVVVNGKPRCSCMDGFYLSTDGRTCIFDEASLRIAVPIQSDNFISMNQILIFVLFMCVVCLIITRIRERKN